MVRGKYAIANQVLLYSFLSLFVLITLYPLLMIISISLQAGYSGTGGSLIPTRPSLEHWQYVLGLDGQKSPVLTWLKNSTIVATVSSALILLLSGSGAYAFSRLEF